MQAVIERDGPRIEVGFVDRQGAVEFFVRDNGPGIPAALQEKIFELFYKQRSGYSGGAGLGLAIAEKAVKAHGGDMWASSDEQGAIFRFTLPKRSSDVSNDDSSLGKRL